MTALRRLAPHLLEETDPERLRQIVRRVCVANAIALLGARTALDLLVTDVVMPGMRGPELAAMLRRERPGLSVLYVTGYATEEFDVADDPLASVSWKPFPMKQLRRAARRMLESAPGERGR